MFSSTWLIQFKHTYPKTNHYNRSALYHTRSWFTRHQVIREEGYDDWFEVHKRACKVLRLQELILRQHNKSLPASLLEHLARRSGFREQQAARFVLKYRECFEVFEHPVKRLLFCRLSDEGLRRVERENQALRAQIPNAITRLRKLVMLTSSGQLTLSYVYAARRDFGLPDDFVGSVVLKNPRLFRVVRSEETGLRCLELVESDPDLAVCAIDRERERLHRRRKSTAEDARFQFVLKYPTRDRMSTRQWQRIPYWSPYADVSGLDVSSPEARRSMRKRVVATVHELLSLTVEKKLSYENITQFRFEMNLPGKLIYFLLRHQGVFHILAKGTRPVCYTIFLREAYRDGKLVKPSELYLARREYAELVWRRFDNCRLKEKPRTMDKDRKWQCRRKGKGRSFCSENWFLSSESSKSQSTRLGIGVT